MWSTYLKQAWLETPFFKFRYLFKEVSSFKDIVLFFLRWSRPLTCFSSCSMISHLWGRPCELWWLSAWLTPRLTNAWPTWMGILNIPILCVEAKKATKMHYAAFQIWSLQQSSKVFFFFFEKLENRITKITKITYFLNFQAVQLWQHNCRWKILNSTYHSCNGKVRSNLIVWIFLPQRLTSHLVQHWFSRFLSCFSQLS